MVRRSLPACIAIAALVLAVGSVQNAHAQGRRGGMMGQGVSPFSVIASPAVQKELGLNEDKVSKVKDIAQDYNEDRQQQLEGAGLGGRPQGDLSTEEREKRETQMAAIVKNVNDKFMPKLNEVLDKTQQTRLHEIAIQVAGPRALRDAEVVKALDLSKDQQDKLKKLGEDMRAKLVEAFAAGGGDRAAIGAKMAEMNEELTAKSNEVLTKDQQAKFTQLKGKPFDVKQLRGGGRGRRRRDNN